jgi:hypothetical protein
MKKSRQESRWFWEAFFEQNQAKVTSAVGCSKMTQQQNWPIFYASYFCFLPDSKIVESGNCGVCLSNEILANLTS